MKLVKLTEKQAICLKFISRNERELLPAGDELPPEVSWLEQQGLIKKAGSIVDEIEGPSSRGPGGNLNRSAWVLTEAGRRRLGKL